MTALDEAPSGARRIVGNTILLSVGQGIGIVSMAVWTILVARRIGPGTYGFYSFAQAVVSILVIFVSFGLDEITTRDVARHPARGRSYLGTVARVKAATSLLVLGGFVAYSFAGTAGRGEVVIVLLVSAMAAAQAFNSLMMALLQAREAMHLFVFGQAANYLLTMVSGVAAVWLDRGFGTILFLSFVASLVQLALTGFFVHRQLPASTAEETFPRLRDLPALTKTSVHFAALTVLTVVQGNMLIILLKGVSYSDRSLGHFAAAQRLATLVLIVPSMVSQVLVPAFSRAFAGDPDRFRGMFERAYRYGVLASVPAAIGLAAAGPDLLVLVFGDEYAPARQTLRVLVLVLLGATGYVLAPALVAMDRQALLSRIQAISLVVTAALAYVLIRELGAEGAAWALVAAAVGTLVLYSRLLFKMLDLPYPTAWVAKTVVAGAAAAGAAFAAAPRANLFVVLLVVTPVVYLAVHLVLRTLSSSDWAYVRSLVGPGR